MPRKKAVREKYHIGIQGESIPVSEDVYYAFYGGKRQEEYQNEQDAKHHVQYVGSFNDEDCELTKSPPANVNIEDEVISKMMKEQLYAAIAKLDDDEQDLIRSVYFEELTLVSIANSLGISECAVRKRINKILKKLKNFF